MQTKDAPLQKEVNFGHGYRVTTPHMPLELKGAR